MSWSFYRYRVLGVIVKLIVSGSLHRRQNGCYIVAPGQIGKKPAYVAYGNSLVADPWGTVIARAKDVPGITYAEIDLDYLDQIRKQIPSLENRRTDLYDVEDKKS